MIATGDATPPIGGLQKFLLSNVCALPETDRGEID
jgi:hypothetical protein